MVEQAVGLCARQMQAVLDAVGASASGEDVPTVRATLVARWQHEFQTTLSDPQLTAWASQLAAGGRVIVRT